MSAESSDLQLESPSPYLGQVKLKQEDGSFGLYLPPLAKDTAEQWEELWQDLKYCLNYSERTWPAQQSVSLQAEDYLLDTRQLQNLADLLGELELDLVRVKTSRRQTAIAAASLGYCVEQNHLVSPFQTKIDQIGVAEPLYLKTTIRSGVEVCHNGTVIVLGDINPGGSIVARGDIIIWGHLRGVVHAGSQGHRESRIFALKMQPTQLRIADVVARLSSLEPHDVQPEIAYLSREGIAIANALQFERYHDFDQAIGSWSEYKSTVIPANL